MQNPLFTPEAASAKPSTAQSPSSRTNTRTNTHPDTIPPPLDTNTPDSPYNVAPDQQTTISHGKRTTIPIRSMKPISGTDAQTPNSAAAPTRKKPSGDGEQNNGTHAARANRRTAGPSFSPALVRVQSPELISQDNDLELELQRALPEPPSDDEPFGPMARTPPHAEHDGERDLASLA